MKQTSVKAGHALRAWGWIISLSALILALGPGCATTKTASITILIESDPSDVRVDVNGEYLGRTPTSYVVRPNHKGDFAGGWGDSPSIVFVAYPPEGSEGLFKQMKSFRPSAFMEKGDRVPARILFDLHQKSGL